MNGFHCHISTPFTLLCPHGFIHSASENPGTRSHPKPWFSRSFPGHLPRPLLPWLHSASENPGICRYSKLWFSGFFPGHLIPWPLLPWLHSASENSRTRSHSKPWFSGFFPGHLILWPLLSLSPTTQSLAHSFTYSYPINTRFILLLPIVIQPSFIYSVHYLRAMGSIP